MRAMVDRMISSGSLSAFSASATNGALSGIRSTPPAQQVQATQARAQSTSPTGQAAGQGGGGPAQPMPMPTPGQPMPRGSLLNLSV